VRIVHVLSVAILLHSHQLFASAEICAFCDNVGDRNIVTCEKSNVFWTAGWCWSYQPVGCGRGPLDEAAPPAAPRLSFPCRSFCWCRATGLGNAAFLSQRSCVVVQLARNMCVLAFNHVSMNVLFLVGSLLADY